MSGTTRGMPIPAGKHLLAFILVLLAGAPMAARADDGMVDVRTLPRLEGAVEEVARTESYRLNYSVPTVVAVTTAATRKLLAANGWQEYVHPSDQSSRPMSFKKGRQGLLLSFSQALGRPDQSVVYYTADRLYAVVPFPEDATDVVYDARRPYLSCITAATVDAGMESFRKGLLEAGWSMLSAADIAARWPNAKLDTIGNGARAYYRRDISDGGPAQPPILLTLQRRGDGKTAVEIRIAPFAQPKNLALARDAIGLPVPDHTAGFGSTGSSDSIRRKVEGKVTAGLPVVLAFYRRELAAQNFREEASGALITDNDVTLNFSSVDQNAQLRLIHKYDLTFVNLFTQVKEAALAARAKAKKEADEKFFRDAQTAAQRIAAADEIRRTALAANLSDAPLRTLADPTKPVPLPDGAENVKFDGADGRLEFDSVASVKALASFYRGSLKSLGWKEQPSVINKSNMVVMEFSRGGKELSFTAMQMGSRVNVSANGSGLVMAAAKADPATSQPPGGSAAKAAVQDLEAEPDSALPVPKQHTMSAMGTGKIPGSAEPFRRDLEASIPAELNTVLAFYRSELGKRGWKETAERAVIKPD